VIGLKSPIWPVLGADFVQTWSFPFLRTKAGSFGFVLPD